MMKVLIGSTTNLGNNNELTKVDGRKGKETQTTRFLKNNFKVGNKSRVSSNLEKDGKARALPSKINAKVIQHGGHQFPFRKNYVVSSS